MEKAFPKASTILKPEDIIRAREVVKDVYMDEKIEKYIIDIVFATRFPQEAGLDKFVSMIAYGGSPRASVSCRFFDRLDSATTVPKEPFIATVQVRTPSNPIPPFV